MKKTFPVYALLLAIYPVIDLYSLQPGGIQPLTIIRPIIIQILITVILFGLFYIRQKKYYAQDCWQGSQYFISLPQAISIDQFGCHLIFQSSTCFWSFWA